MYDSSSSHFFRTTTGMQSGLDAFNKSRLVMNWELHEYYAVSLQLFSVGIERYQWHEEVKRSSK